MRFSLFLVFLVFLLQSHSILSELTEELKGYLSKASRNDTNGWIYLKISGKPYERGFQHGYLLASEYGEYLKATVDLTYQTTGMTYKFFIDKAIEFHKDKIPQELLDEMQGIADGLTQGGVQQTLNDVIGWNALTEISGYWWPTVLTQYGSVNKPKGKFAKSHCSAFVAVGKATTDGKIVIGHETFTDFWNGQYGNIVLDVAPEKGLRFIMQTSPGYISSMTDIYLNVAGLAIVETTIVGFVGYNSSAIPEYVRARVATQYASSIDEWVNIVNTGNNGGYANMWLLGDFNSGEIASFEQGLKFQAFNKKTDGFFFGENAPFDPRIRNLECVDVGYNDIRQQTGARRVRWGQLMEENFGKIDLKVGQKMLADTYDVYLEKNNPSSRTICSHYDVDPQYYASDPNAVWNDPYTPAGSTDGKVISADLAKNLQMSAIFGRASGVTFEAQPFLKKHPQWNWQSPYLKDRPAQPWTVVGSL